MPSASLEGGNNQLACMVESMKSFHSNGFSVYACGLESAGSLEERSQGLSSEILIHWHLPCVAPEHSFYGYLLLSVPIMQGGK